MSDCYQRYPWVVTANGQTVGRLKYQADAKALYRVRAEAKGDSTGLDLLYAPWPIAGVEEPVSRRGHLREGES
jgi:hypothetical protein